MTPPIDLDPMIGWLLRLALAGVFAQAAWHKASDLGAAAQTIADYAVVPTGWARGVALGVSGAEATVAVGFVLTGFGPASVGGVVTACVAVGLLALYATAISINLARGRRDIDCGCLGPAGGSVRIGPWLLVRNAVLAFAATSLAVLPASGRALHWFDALSLVGGWAALALVWTSIHTLAATPVAPAQRGGLR